jgi:hypothetical protein
MSDINPSRFVVALLGVISAFAAQAADVTVDCSKKNSKTIAATLATLDKNVPNTVTIKGTCVENLVIQRFKDLTLAGSGGAGISDLTPLALVDKHVVEIWSSNVTIRSLVINGGAGVRCWEQSNCRLVDTTVQDGAGDGVMVFLSNLSLLGNSVLQNNQGLGLSAFGSTVNLDSDLMNGIASGPYPTIQGNVSGGVLVWDRSYLRALRATIQNNPGGPGVNADNGSSIRLIATTITGNGTEGIDLRASMARISGLPGATETDPGEPITITGNTGNGILVRNLSFLRLYGPRSITGNESGAPVPLDVNCAASTASAVGVGSSGSPASGVGSTNCPSPAP